MNESQKNNKKDQWIQEERRYHNNKAKFQMCYYKDRRSILRYPYNLLKLL